MSTEWANFLVGFGGPIPLRAHVMATSFSRQKWPKKSKMKTEYCNLDFSSPIDK